MTVTVTERRKRKNHQKERVSGNQQLLDRISLQTMIEPESKGCQQNSQKTIQNETQKKTDVSKSL
jgi:hypothetical protein